MVDVKQTPVKVRVSSEGDEILLDTGCDLRLRLMPAEAARLAGMLLTAVSDQIINKAKGIKG